MCIYLRTSPFFTRTEEHLIAFTYGAVWSRAAKVFVPCMPLLDGAQQRAGDDAALVTANGGAGGDGGDGGGAVTLSRADWSRLMDYERQELQKAFEFAATLASRAPVGGDTTAMLSVVVALVHLSVTCATLALSVDYLELLLRRHLVAAIGKTVGASDFADYMRFHNRKMFAPHAAPRAFSYAVRRPQHDPEGALSVHWVPRGAAATDTELLPIFVHTRALYGAAEPVSVDAQGLELTAEGAAAGSDGDTRALSTTTTTTVATAATTTAAPVMRLPLNASTEAMFRGNHYLHAFVHHAFAAPLPAQPSARMPLAAESLLCSGGHALTVSLVRTGKYFAGWVCDSCSCRGDGLRYNCTDCVYDVCFHCAGVQNPVMTCPERHVLFTVRLTAFSFISSYKLFQSSSQLLCVCACVCRFLS